MQRVSVAILHCAEYNFAKLKEHCGEPRSPEQALRWDLEGGITKCVGLLLFSETYHWNKISLCNCLEVCRGKERPAKLRKNLHALIKDTSTIEAEVERIAELRKGIARQIVYIENIKKNKRYVNSVALKEISEHLKYLFDMKIPSNEIRKPEECL